jgi:hypothetical protein
MAAPLDTAANVQRRYPQGVATGGASAIAFVLIWILVHILGWPIDSEAASFFTGAIVTALAFIGRRGIKGLFTIAWRGDDDK